MAAQKVTAPPLSQDTRGVPCGLQLHASVPCAPAGRSIFNSCPCSVCTAGQNQVISHAYQASQQIDRAGSLISKCLVQPPLACRNKTRKILGTLPWPQIGLSFISNPPKTLRLLPCLMKRVKTGMTHRPDVDGAVCRAGGRVALVGA